MRDGECFHEQFVKLKAVAGVKKPPVNFFLEFFGTIQAFRNHFFLAAPLGAERPDGRVLSGSVAENGDLQFVGKSQKSADVIGMLVGEENSTEIFRRAPDGRQPLADLARAKASINENAGFAALQIGAIPGGTAAKNGKLNRHGATLAGRAFQGNFFTR